MSKREHISNWLKEKAIEANKDGFVVGVSGGVDSALTSTLCAMTGMTTWCLMMPINQAHDQVLRAHNHLNWLTDRFVNVNFNTVALTSTFNELSWVLPPDANDLALANSKSRLRMVALYAYATTYNLLVAGTGNKVEDFGVGFFTKYGDGGVDLSPIGSLTKTEVWSLAKELGINQEIIDATPTDGLWNDNRGDEDQIGASYPELEWAMEWNDLNNPTLIGFSGLTDRQKKVLEIYNEYHNKNRHKMEPIPICPKN